VPEHPLSPVAALPSGSPLPKRGETRGPESYERGLICMCMRLPLLPGPESRKQSTLLSGILAIPKRDIGDDINLFKIPLVKKKSMCEICLLLIPVQKHFSIMSQKPGGWLRV
jgi:hypothetical protein